jgi:hypothetical protein
MGDVSTICRKPPARRKRHWLFQANPNKYRINESLRAEQHEEWNLNQHAKDIATGDRVGIWICGELAGLYAIGTVASSPVVKADSEAGIGYWTNPQDGRRPKPRVQVRYDRVFLDRPLLKQYIEADPALEEMQILRSPRGTNFPLSSEEWAALEAWLDE